MTQPKFFVLVKVESGGPGWSDWYYTWRPEDESEGKEIILRVSEKVYLLIKEENI